MIEIEVMVEHSEFGIGKIIEISYDTGTPLIAVQWNDGRRGHYLMEELEFLIERRS